MFYKISDGRLWDVDAAQFMDQAPEGAEIIPLYADGNPAGEDYLRRTLEFYGYPVGPELLTLEELKAANCWPEAGQTMPISSSNAPAAGRIPSCGPRAPIMQAVEPLLWRHRGRKTQTIPSADSERLAAALGRAARLHHGSNRGAMFRHGRLLCGPDPLCHGPRRHHRTPLQPPRSQQQLPAPRRLP